MSKPGDWGNTIEVGAANIPASVQPKISHIVALFLSGQACSLEQKTYTSDDDTAVRVFSALDAHGRVICVLRWMQE